MGEAGRDEFEGSIPKHVPEGRCGLTIHYEDQPWPPGHRRCRPHRRHLEDADLIETTLQNADLVDANLRKATLIKSDLTGATLTDL